jgi:hypothetical protein
MGTDLSTIYQAKWWHWSVLIATNKRGDNTHVGKVAVLSTFKQTNKQACT